jgi:hypothetical protein
MVAVESRMSIPGAKLSAPKCTEAQDCSGGSRSAELFRIHEGAHRSLIDSQISNIHD